MAKFITKKCQIDSKNFDIIIDNTKSYMNLNDVSLLYGFNKNTTHRALNNLIEYHMAIDNLLFIDTDSSYYDLNVVLLLGINYNKPICLDIYKSIKEVNLDNYVFNYIKDTLNTFATNTNLNTIDIIDDYVDIFKTLSKKNVVHDDCCFINCLNADECYKLIENIKERYYFSNNFGKEKQARSLYEILNDFENETIILDEEIQTMTIENMAAKLLYTLIKKQPFIDNNSELSCILVIEFLRKNQRLVTNFKYNILSTDLTYAISLIENSSLSKENIINEVSNFLSKTTSHSFAKSIKLYQNLKDNYSYNNVIKYIVAYVEDFWGKQGYYDYFNVSEHAKKLYYSGNYYNFKLNVSKTIQSSKTLCFDVLATANIEIPKKMKNRSLVIEDLVEEIKKRSYKDVIENDLLKSLKDNLKGLFNLNAITITFNILWHVIDEDEN